MGVDFSMGVLVYGTASLGGMVGLLLGCLGERGDYGRSVFKETTTRRDGKSAFLPSSSELDTRAKWPICAYVLEVLMASWGV